VVETYYIAPVYTGIIVMNPPEKKPVRPPRKRRDGREDEKEKEEEDVPAEAVEADARRP
jgi:hypothetical protein